MNCSTPVHHLLPEFTQTHVHRVGDAIQPLHPLSSPSPPAPNPSQHQGLFQWVNSSPKYWSFSFSISPSYEHPGLISFRIDWLDLLAVQGTLKSLHHHSSKASILRCSASSQHNRNPIIYWWLIKWIPRTLFQVIIQWVNITSYYVFYDVSRCLMRLS